MIYTPVGNAHNTHSTILEEKTRLEFLPAAVLFGSSLLTGRAFFCAAADGAHV